MMLFSVCEPHTKVDFVTIEGLFVLFEGREVQAQNECPKGILSLSETR